MGEKRAIVSGGAGFVGAALVRDLLANGWDVDVVVRPGFNVSGSRLKGLDVGLLECDIRDIGALESMVDRRYACWYQFAWDGLFNEPLLDYERQIMNIKWTMDAIVLAGKIGCRRFIGAGSISQCELQVLAGQISEADKHKVYKTAKLACEYMGRSVAATNGIEFFWPLITNIYGPGEFSPRLINTMIRNLVAGKPQSLSEGRQFYDFIYISDAAKAFRLIAEKGVQHRNYVIASGGVQPLREFLETVAEVVGADPELLRFGELRFNGIHLPKQDYSTGPLVEDTGFAPDVSFAEGIRRTAEWIRQRDGNDEKGERQ